MKRIFFLINAFLIIVSCANLSGETVKIIGVNGKEKILRFDSSVTEITLSKTIPKIRRIEGLSQFRNLKKLSINFSDLRETDFSFLEKIENLKKLEFNFVDLKDINFISKLPSLVVFSCYDSVDIANLNIIDLEKSNNLEYLGLLIYELKDIPKIINVPESLKYVDFNYSLFNKIDLETLNLLSSYKNVSYIFSDEIETCMRKLKLNINLYDNSKYEELLKHYNIY